MLRIRVLGPLGAEVGGEPVDLGTPRQRAVLALLTAARGGVVPVDRMTDALWRGEPPAKARVSLHSYVSNLRRSLEPGRPPHTPATVLVTAPPGYALRLSRDAVDAWRFEASVGRARRAPADEARALLTEALGWWQGPAFAEHADETWAASEVACLTELRTEAGELAVAADLRTGRVAEAVLAAEVLVGQSPLREEGWRLLALAHWACGRQSDALATLRRATRTLREELGCDPGPALAQLERAVLTQRLEVLDTAAPMHTASAVPASASLVPTPASGAVPVPAVPAPAAPAAAAPVPAQATGAAPPSAVGVPPSARLVLTPVSGGIGEGAGLPAVGPGTGVPATGLAGGEVRSGNALFVGRTGELRALEAAAREARCGGGVALVSGEAGAGKSALLERLVGVLRADGWAVVVGRCPEYEGAPPAWAWVEALGELARDLPPARPGELDVLLREPASTAATTRDEATAGRFRMHRAFAAWLRAAATAAPLAAVLEDLHHADGETLALLEVAAAVTGVPLLTVASYRPAEGGEHLVKTLAQLALGAPHRVALRGLPPEDVATVVDAVCGGPVDATTVAVLAERTGGNPFYVLDSARLLAGEGAMVAVSEVPQGVRDVLRRRLALLPAGARAAVRLTAAVGLEAEVALLVDAADTDEDEVVEGLDAALSADLLTEPAQSIR